MNKKRKSGLEKGQIVDPLQWARDYLPAGELDSLVALMDQPLPSAIRLNQLKTKPETHLEKWSQFYQWTTQPIPFCSSGYWITDPDVAVSKTIEHKLGYFYIQESASMLPAELFDFSGNERPLILDMAASPGGKTTHLVDKTHDRGLVIANDASRSRIPALKVVLQNWGAANVAITAMQGEWFGQAFPNTFDAVLLDAPCSMQGLRISDSHTARPITQSEIEKLADRQVNMLESALATAKPGGQIVYSTCTLSPLENEHVIATIYDRHPDKVEIADIQEKIPGSAPALSNFSGNQFQPEVQRAARLWPQIFSTAGFFCAKLVKKENSKIETSQFQEKQNLTLNKESLTESNRADFLEFILDSYGYDLQILMESQNLSLVQLNRDIFLIPDQFQSLFPDLPIMLLGMQVGRSVPKGWLPSHEFVSRFGDQFKCGIRILEEDHLDAWLRGEDIRGISMDGQNTTQVVNIRDSRGRNLGRGKVLADRLKNMLPTRLF